MWQSAIRDAGTPSLSLASSGHLPVLKGANLCAVALKAGGDGQSSYLVISSVMSHCNNPGCILQSTEILNPLIP